MAEVLKTSSKTGDRVTAISDLQNNEEHVLFSGSQKFPEKVFSPQVPKN